MKLPNGKEVSGGRKCNPRKGYICLESEGSECHFRNIRIKELPSTNPPPAEVNEAYQGFEALYSGLDFRGWKLLPDEDSPFDPDKSMVEVLPEPQAWLDRVFRDPLVAVAESARRLGRRVFRR